MIQQTLLQTPRNSYPPDFEAVWQAYPRRGRTRGANDNKIAAARAYNQRIRQGHSPQEIMQGVEAYAEYIRAQGHEGTPYVKQCATFLGPDCHFLCEWEPPEEKKALPKTDDEWLAAGRELGLNPKPGENWFGFKDRVKARMVTA